MNKEKKITTGDAAIKGVRNFINKYDSNLLVEEVCFKYCQDEQLMILATETTLICEDIQKDFGKFVKWFRKMQKDTK